MKWSQRNTATIPLTGGETVGLIQGGVDVRATVEALALASVDGIYYSASFASLDAAITAISSTPGTLIIHSAISAILDVTVPTTLCVVFTGGGILTVPNTKTVTFNGPFDAPLNKVFTLTGSGSVAFGGSSLRAVKPEWWSATDGVQKAITAAESDTVPTAYVELNKAYTLAAGLSCTKAHLRIQGKGIHESGLNYAGIAAACITTTAIPYWRPTFCDFSITGNAASGIGIDGSNVTTTVYDGSFERLVIDAGQQALYFPSLFNFKIYRVRGSSINNHVFHASCNNTVVWDTCYATNAPANKAGYRLTGEITMIGCNGLDTAYWWGVFGSDTGGSNGFQTDFSTTSYPSITLIGCNIENFITGGLYVTQAWSHFSIIGGKIDRSLLGTDYHSMITWNKNPEWANAPIRIRLAQLFKGSGNPVGSGAYTTAWLYSQSATSAYVIDESGCLSANGIPGVVSDASGGITYPLMTHFIAQDNFQQMAHSFNAIYPRRLSVRMLRYDTTTLTPSGSAAAIVVTGYTKVIVTPVADCDISTATFVTTLGIESDANRNGDLIIQAGNAHLTVNHTARGGAANTFVLAGGSNLALAGGQILRFCRSTTTSQWEQV